MRHSRLAVIAVLMALAMAGACGKKKPPGGAAAAGAAPDGDDHPDRGTGRRRRPSR